MIHPDRYNQCRLLVLLLILCAGFPPGVDARIYSLRPGSGIADVEQLLNTKAILQDTIKVNGASARLTVAISDRDMVHVMQDLQGILAEYESLRGQASVLIDVPAGQQLRRYLIMRADEATKTLVFRIDMPKAGLADDPGRFWPRNLPQPTAITVEQVMDMSKRQAVYVRFTTHSSPAELVARYHGQLLASGWQQVTKSENGAAYMRKETGQMLLVSAVAGKNLSHGSVFLRAIHPR